MLNHRLAPWRARILLALCCVLCCVLCNTPLSAQQPPPPPPPGTQAPSQPGTPAEKQPDYGQWWLVHAREVNPKPRGWLFHTEGQGSFANSTGSLSGFEFALNALAALRKNLVTNQVGASFTIDDQRLEDGQGSLEQSMVRLSNMLFINVAKPLDLVTVVIWEKDDPKHVIRRVAVFEGLSRSVRFSKGRVLGLAAAVGYEAERFLTPTGEEDENAPIAYLQNTYNAPIAMKGMFTHFIETFFNLENKDDVRVNWNLGLNFQLTPHIGIGPTAQIRYDSRPVTQVQSTDTMVMIAVRFK